MKNYNVTLTKTKISDMNNRAQTLSFLRLLDYELEPFVWLPPENWSATRSIYRSSEENGFQTWFFEMGNVTKSQIYPIITNIIHNHP
ncbi:hypothetical protein K8T06_14005 [bacterium]|nr:hypothetical protein [bacterium]